MPTDLTTIRAVAPLRISFVGGGTDFPHYFEEHGGAVLSATIDHEVRVTIVPREDRQVIVRSLDLGHLVEYHLDAGPIYDGVMDLAKGAIHRVGVPGGIEMDIDSDAPAGSGLGGSSALVTAVVAGLEMLSERRLDAHELARLCYSIERDDLEISGERDLASTECIDQRHIGQGDPYDRDGEMKTLQHRERIGTVPGPNRWPREDARRARGQRGRKRRGSLRIRQAEVDGCDRFGGARIRQVRCHRDQVGQVHPRFDASGREPQRVGRRLVRAVDAEEPRPGPRSVQRQRHRVAGTELFNIKVVR